jgi:hypothetical protein
MRQVTASSVGSIWRSDVLHVTHFDSVEVVDLDGKRIAIVDIHPDARGHGTYYVDDRRISFKNLWELMHKWSDIISAQNARNFAATCKTISEGFRPSQIV